MQAGVGREDALAPTIPSFISSSLPACSAHSEPRCRPSLSVTCVQVFRHDMFKTVNPDSGEQGLPIGELVARTGLSEGTLRMWERRHGFPLPRRRPSGHRRYDESDVELIRRVARHRDAGLSLPAAIARARDSVSDVERSVFAGMRRRHPELQPVRLRKAVLLALSRAIE